MLIPLVDILRCPKPHEETWLVASIDRAELRDIIDGTLGCPHCRSEYAIRDGIVYFDERAERAAPAEPSEAQAVRLAAALDLTDPRMIVVLHGSWGTQAPLLRGLASAPLLLVNPPVEITSGDGISIVVAHRAPLARASIDAIAVDETASAEMAATLRSSLRGGKRMLAPANTPVPSDFTELARDADVWVAQLQAQAVTSAPIMPARRAR
jgi:uncharacterized protein YbaR (Trm112 family)